MRRSASAEQSRIAGAGGSSSTDDISPHLHASVDPRAVAPIYRRLVSVRRAPVRKSCVGAVDTSTKCSANGASGERSAIDRPHVPHGAEDVRRGARNYEHRLNSGRKVATLCAGRTWWWSGATNRGLVRSCVRGGAYGRASWSSCAPPRIGRHPNADSDGPRGHRVAAMGRRHPGHDQAADDVAAALDDEQGNDRHRLTQDPGPQGADE